MTYFRFSTRDLLWMMVVVSIGLIAWREHQLHVVSRAKVVELEKAVQTLNLTVRACFEVVAERPRKIPASEAFGDLPLKEAEADGRTSDPLEEFLRSDMGHLLIR